MFIYYDKYNHNHYNDFNTTTIIICVKKIMKQRGDGDTNR